MNPTKGIFLLALVSSLCCHAQDADEILACGKVRDATTNRGVQATIRYSSLPTGSIYGKFNDSTFRFTIFGAARYEITAEAQGYNAATVVLDPSQLRGKDMLERDIRLIPTGETTLRLNRLIFARGRSEISRESYDELDDLAMLMHDNRDIRIQLEGHTDNAGSADANLKLSAERVDAVRDYLVRKGVSRSRISTKAFGGSRPVRNEQTPEARAMNRRVEVRILRN